MKKKDYLRGIGVGVLVTSVIFAIANNVNKMTDDDIIRRSIELGAVYETQNPYLSEVSSTSETKEPVKTDSPTNEDVEADKSDVPDSGNNESAPEITEPQSSEDTINAEDTVPLDAPEPTEIPEVTEEPVPTEAPIVTPKPELGDSYKLVISRGQGSYQVALALEEAGVVDSARDFDKYLVDKKYESKIRVGTYNVPYEYSWEEIAELIAG